MKFTEILSALVKAKIKISNNENSAFPITTVRVRLVPHTLKVGVLHYS